MDHIVLPLLLPPMPEVLHLELLRDLLPLLRLVVIMFFLAADGVIIVLRWLHVVEQAAIAWKDGRLRVGTLVGCLLNLFGLRDDSLE